MDFILLKNFLAHYSLPTVIIAISVSIITAILRKAVKEKLHKTIFSYMPFLLATVFYLAYDMIMVINAFTIRTEAIYAGLLSGSLSAVILSAVKKISQGKPLGISATVILIEGLLDGYIGEKHLTEVATILDKIIKTENENKTEQVYIALKDNAEGFTETELTHLAGIIVQAVNSITGE